MSAQGIVGALAAHPFFRDLSERHLMLLASGVKPFAAGAGEFLARAGENARVFYLIQAGKVTLAAPARGGEVVIQTVQPGEVVGWSWLVPPHRWEFNARAEGEVSGLAFDAEWLREKCEQDHGLSHALLKRLVEVLARRLTATRRQLVEARQGETLAV